jgi:predicted oxidoreductase
MSSIVRSGYKGRNFHKPDESQREINERVQKIAKDKGVSMAQVSTVD